MELPRLTCYISGPMTGYKDFNYPAFYQAEEMLKKKGLFVINPARLAEEMRERGELADLDEAAEYQALLTNDRDYIPSCDVIYFLANWHLSAGAIIERKDARRAGLIEWYEPCLEAFDYHAGEKAGYKRGYETAQEITRRKIRLDKVSIDGLNKANYHSLLVRVDSVGYPAGGEVDLQTSGEYGLDPFLIFSGPDVQEVVRTVRPGSWLLVSARLRSKGRGEYLFLVHTWERIHNPRGSWSLRENMVKDAPE